MYQRRLLNSRAGVVCREADGEKRRGLADDICFYDKARLFLKTEVLHARSPKGGQSTHERRRLRVMTELVQHSVHREAHIAEMSPRVIQMAWFGYISHQSLMEEGNLHVSQPEVCLSLCRLV